MSTTVLERVCANCGASLEGKRSIAKACSVACNHALLAARRKAEKWEGVDPDRGCLRCGGSMAGKRPHATYCSRKCKAAATQSRRSSHVDRVRLSPAGTVIMCAPKTKTCRRCDEDFTTDRASVAYCSDACREAAFRDRTRAYARRYLAENAERMRAIRRNRRSAIKAERCLVTNRDWRRLVARYCGCCAYCGVRTNELQREHVVPISRGGRHSIGNLLPSCAPCNYRKHTKFLAEWRAEMARG